MTRPDSRSRIWKRGAPRGIFAAFALGIALLLPVRVAAQTPTSVPTSSTSTTTLPPRVTCQVRAARAAQRYHTGVLECEKKDFPERLDSDLVSDDLSTCTEQAKAGYEKGLNEIQKQNSECPDCVGSEQNRGIVVGITPPIVECSVSGEGTKKAVRRARKNAVRCNRRLHSEMRTLAKKVVKCGKKAASSAHAAETDSSGTWDRVFESCASGELDKYRERVGDEERFRSCPQCLAKRFRKEQGDRVRADAGNVVKASYCGCSLDDCSDTFCATFACGPDDNCKPTARSLGQECEDASTPQCMLRKCDSRGECSLPEGTGRFRPEGEQCNDGNRCTENDTCDGAGNCTKGTDKLCVPIDACHDAGLCDEKTGLCTNPPKQPGEQCEPPNRDPLCYTGMCVQGRCEGVQICDDSNPCTHNRCLPTGCEHPQVADGTPCDRDGNPCTVDVCFSGECTGTQPPEEQDGIPCEADCVPNGVCKAGVCVGEPVPVGGACASARDCTNVEDTCNERVCVRMCEDGDACTIRETCQDGTCVPGPRLSGCP
jgi:hypothetical protein